MGVAVGGGFGHAAADEERFDALAELALVGDEVVDEQRLGEDGADAHARVEAACGILEDDLHVAAEALERVATCGDHVFAFEEDAAAGGWDEAQECAADGGFAAAGFTDETECFAFGDVEGDAIDGFDIAADALEQARANREVRLEVLDLQDGGGGVGGHCRIVKR